MLVRTRMRGERVGEMTVGPPDPVERPGQGDPAPPSLRASDDERHRTVELLGEHAAAGRITLSELEERVGRAYAAATRAELAELAQDLPALSKASEPPEPATRGRRPTQWFFAVMGGSTRRGRRRLSGRVNVISIMGGDEIDLREAEIEGSEIVINVCSIMGGSAIYVPDSVELEISGFAIMGGNDERGSTRQARPSAPVIRIRTFAIMGGIDVWRLPAETRGLRLKEARRVAKALESGKQ